MSGTAVVNVMGLVTVYMTYAGDMTVGDVKSWLQKVEELGIPDNTRLESGMLKISYRTPVVQSIECGDCAPQRQHTGYTLFSRTCEEVEKED